MIDYQLKGFMVKNSEPVPKKIHAHIRFINSNEITVIYFKPKRQKYVRYYEKLSRPAYYYQTYFTISIAQFSLIIKDVFIDLFTRCNGLILHASASCIQDKAVIFTGKSGIGKTTIMKHLSNNYKPLGDDSIIVRKIKGRYYCYQTPFVEKEYWFERNSMGYPLSHCFVLGQGEKIINRKILSVDKRFSYLEKETYSTIQNHKSIMQQLLSLCKTNNLIYYLKVPNNQQSVLNYFKNLKI
jgi:hypothetical protein